MESYEKIKYEPLADSVFNYLFSDRGCEKTKTKYCGGNHSLAYKERFPRNTSKKAVWIG